MKGGIDGRKRTATTLGVVCAVGAGRGGGRMGTPATIIPRTIMRRMIMATIIMTSIVTTIITTTITPMLMTTSEPVPADVPDGMTADEGAALYRLMTWLSPAFPVGAFSYSSG